MSNQEYRTHGGGLYCGEGGVHVSRSSTRVRAPPGGHSSISFGSDAPTYNQPSQGNRSNQSYGNQTYGNQSYGNQSYGNQSYGNQSYGNQSYGNQSYGNQSYGNQSFDRQPEQNNVNNTPQKSGQYSSPLFCGEGNVHVARRSTRVQAPPGGASSITF